MRTYNEVCKIINEMVSSCEKITVRNVLARVGGTSAKVAEYVKRWHEERNSQVENVISDVLQQAIVADRNIVVNKAVEDYRKKVVFLNDTMQDLQSILKEREELLVDCNNKIEKLNVQLIEAKQRNTTYKESVVELERKLDISIKEQNKASMECAKTLVQLKNVDNSIVELKSIVKDLREQLVLESKARHLAEKNVAVLQSKYEQK